MRDQALYWLAQNLAHYSADGLTAAGRAAALLKSEPGGIQTLSDFGAEIADNLENWETEWEALSPEEASDTVARTADVHRVNIDTVLAWLKIGLPYTKTGNWGTGANFTLNYFWTWSWLRATAICLDAHGERALLKRLQLEPYLDLDYHPGDDA